jgi:hypothetical protein
VIRPGRDDVPQVVNSENEMMPMFWLQSTAFGMHTLLFQSWSTLGEYAFLLNVFAPTVRLFTIVARTQSQLARWRSPSKVLRENSLKGAGSPVAPFGPGLVPLLVRLKTYATRCVLLML